MADATQSGVGAGGSPVAEPRWCWRSSLARRFGYWLPPLLLMALIYGGSTDLLSEQHTSRFVVPVLRWFKPDISRAALRQAQFLVRKTAHFSEYALLALLVLTALRQSLHGLAHEWSWRHAFLSLVVCAAYAASDEFHQSFVPSRYGSAQDVMIDVAGATSALALAWLVGRWRKRW